MLGKDKVLRRKGWFIRRSYYFDRRLDYSRRYIKVLIAVACLINLLLLIPDLLQIKSAEYRFDIALLRVLFSLLLLFICTKIDSIASFRKLSVIISICELLAAGVFFAVFSLYASPSFMIQAMGLIILILVIFLVPNHWVYMLSVSIISAVGFFLCASAFIGSIDATEFAAATAYIGITILLCSISAGNSERHQYREFLVKDELERISKTDFLTHTANRLKLSEDAAKWIDFCKRQNLPLSLVFFDVDDLKNINDRYGHSAGDNLLAGLARLTQCQLRSTDVLARWGGDEFVMLLPSVSIDNAIALTERIELSVRENILIDGEKITCSFGVAEMKKDSTFEDLVREADSLMYSAKQRGKDMVQYSK
ncbi:MAG: GGDEF domain-containing protein [Oscillospiraceae bacterium]|nr:GGDEF domain-containing protein [Oscillospiraceae bacterium]